MIKHPGNKAIMIIALGSIAIWSMYAEDSTTLATIVGAFILMLKGD